MVVRTNPKAPTGNPTFMVLTNGDPDPETGLKSVDWWGPWRCDPPIRRRGWDRWIFRHLYCTGSEGGIGWDLTCQEGAEFSAIVEDCVGMGRFAGACVMAHVGRPTDRSCSGAAISCASMAGATPARSMSAPTTRPCRHARRRVRGLHPGGGDNALQAGYPGFDGYTRVGSRTRG